MNISEFERAKPTETLKAINSLITKLKEMSAENSSCNPDWVVGQLEDIKVLFKYGA